TRERGHTRSIAPLFGVDSPKTSVAEDGLRAHEVAGVAVGMLLQEVLVLFLGLPERTRLLDLGHEGLAPLADLVQVLLVLLGLLALRLGRVEDLRAVGVADVVALAVER